MILGVDVSAWNTKVPWKDLVEKGGIQFAVIKGDQAVATANHFALARAAGVPVVGMYVWHDPTIPAARQAAEFLEDCKANKPDFVFLDVEQFWSDWAKWADWQYYHKITQAQVPRAAPSKISSSAHDVMQILSDALTCPVGMYSAKWFIEGFAPGIVTWAIEYPLWIMSIISEPVHEATWVEVKAGPPANFKVNMPAKMTTWLMAQWSSGKRLPGSQDRIDLNMFPGTLDAFRSWAGLQTPALTLEQRVQALEAWRLAHG